MNAPKAMLILLALAACAPEVPESGVGFGDYSEYVRQREAQTARPVPVTPTAPVFSTDRVGAALDSVDRPGAPLSAVPPTPTGGPAVGRIIGQAPATERPRGNAPAGIREETGEIVGSARISDEQDFGAVSSRETIQSNAERIAQQRAQYQVVQPTALPQRTDAGGPNIVQYALSTQHSPGTKLYNRSRLFAKDPLIACARYTAPDIAQEAFLANGGPERDREGLDPDGDGFACGWDPRPFRTALR